ncbi:nicotinate-nicotinamide nucleotide adenylyltransferase [Candidatus Saccharibacteria bacterium]|nr:nicotinate-nicotinamide nucleotide adenylyltransferase [Candidatus Saccharibacteria bacterium]
MKKAIIYGGAFNPPTVAHQAILQACVEYARAVSAEVWLLPSGERADKTIQVSTEKRIKFLEACISEVDTNGVRHRIETIELLSTEKTQTYGTFSEISRKYADIEQIWVFGSDSITTMKQWYNGDWLYNNLPMLIVPRPGFEITSLPPHAQFLQVDSAEMSSTIVRELMHLQQDFSHLVPAAVHRILLAD